MTEKVIQARKIIRCDGCNNPFLEVKDIEIYSTNKMDARKELDNKIEEWEDSLNDIKCKSCEN